MTTTTATSVPPATREGPRGGWLSRMGAWSATHLKVVLLGWLIAVAALGAFAPQVETVLSGGGWQDSGSQSVAARNLIAEDFAGLGSTALQVVVHDSNDTVAHDPAAQRVVARVTAALQADHRISTVVPSRPGLSVSRDGRTAIVQGGAAVGANEMIRVADDLVGPLRRLSTRSVTVQVTGASALWASFNKVNRTAMIKSEVLSWPVTMLVLVLAFGSLVAAGLPLMLTLAGLETAAGGLVLATRLAPVSIWAMNFALMFALALGIDYALFIVVRFRAALHGRAGDADPSARSPTRS
jgi:RND superfamily putative drug exporter